MLNRLLYRRDGRRDCCIVEVGSGLFAAAFMQRFPTLAVEEDKRRNNPQLRENFVERILGPGTFPYLSLQGQTL